METCQRYSRRGSAGKDSRISSVRAEEEAEVIGHSFPNRLVIRADNLPRGFGIVHIAGQSSYMSTLDVWEASELNGTLVRSLRNTHALRVVRSIDVGAYICSPEDHTVQLKNDFYLLISNPPIINEHS
jgi:uncharacterized protein YcsI (UPF0317 family)